MDPFAPAWLRIPQPPAPHNGHHATGGQSFSRSVNGTMSPNGRFDARRGSPEQQQLSSRYMGVNGGNGLASSIGLPPLRTSSLDDGHFEGTSFPAGQWKPQPSILGSQQHGERMRAKAASVSESSRHSTRLTSGSSSCAPAGVSGNSFNHHNHQLVHHHKQMHGLVSGNNNSHVSHVSSSGTTGATAVTPAHASSKGLGNGVPDFRELASFQFHTRRSGSFGSEAVSQTTTAGAAGNSGLNGVGVSGSGGGSSDPCSSEDDISAASNPSSGGHRFNSSSSSSLSSMARGLTKAHVAPVTRFQQEFPSLAPTPSLSEGQEGRTGTVWDSSAKLKVLGGSGNMKKLWAKPSAGPAIPGDSISSSSMNSTTTMMSGKSKNAVPTPAVLPVMEILVKNPKIHSSSRSDFFKSLRSSSSAASTALTSTKTSVTTNSSSGATPATSGSSDSKAKSSSRDQSTGSSMSSISSPANESSDASTGRKDSVDDVFRSMDSSDGKENVPHSTAHMQIPGKVFNGPSQQETEEDRLNDGEDGRWIGRSADSILSSSLEAEQRLLKEMGWKEEDELNDEPLTEDEVREFQDLIMARKSATGGSSLDPAVSLSLLPSSTDLMTSSKNWRNVTGTWFPGRNINSRMTTGVSTVASVVPPSSGRKSINSSLASPQFDDDRSSSSSSSDDSSDEDEDLVSGRVTAALTGTPFPHPIS